MKLSKEKYFGLGSVPVGIGAVLKGWNFTEEQFRQSGTLPVLDLRVMTEACPHNCRHCFTEKRKRTLTLPQIKGLLDQIADLGGRTVDYLGEGEPTIDPNFLEIIEYTAKKGIQPVIFTDAATKMRDRNFVRRVYDTGATVCPKCDSLFNPDYENSVVGDRKGVFFDQRNEALELLIQEGFNKVQEDGSTRLGLDMVLAKENIHEVERALRFARERNIWISFVFPLPVGRSDPKNACFDKGVLPTYEEMQKVRETVQRVDAEYGFNHTIYRNFATSPCVEVLCVYGNGNVSACVGREEVEGNITTEPLKQIVGRIDEKYPCHNRATFDGHCIIR